MSQLEAMGAIEAVVFDMDGTLVDSEVYTEQAIRALLDERGIRAPDLDLRRFHGLTWRAIDAQLRQRFAPIAGEPLAAALQQRFDALWVASPPPPVPGAREAFAAASALLPTAIVTSSNRQSVELLLDHLDLRQQCRLIVCAEDCSRSKPDPQCYQLAVRRLGSTPRGCLVFEDSLAGLQAARAAGARPVAITRGKTGEQLRAACALAEACIEDYRELPRDFFSSTRRGPRQ